MLLTQAKVLAHGLKYAFDTPSGIPYNRLLLELRSHAPAQETNTLAAAGSLVLEWQHLADLTTDSTYSDVVQRTQSHILNPRPPNDNLHPGLLGTHIDIATGHFQDSWGSWGAGRDSAYEYLLKMFIYDRERYSSYGDRWRLAADSTMAHIASHPIGRDDVLFLSDWGGKRQINKSDHLAAFAAGNFILGGSTFEEQKYVDFGLELVNGLHVLMESTATGLSPEIYRWDAVQVPPEHAAFFQNHGFWISNAVYNTRPEVMESYYYAYRVSNDTKYRDWAWDGFRNVVAACQADLGLSYIDNVDETDPLGGKKLDVQDSFLFSEVFKYAYLTFAGDEVAGQIRRQGRNGWVFNTEGHPFRVAGW
jgi:mannosyl-oligosaccharide alpha-1,2-mannosidase